MTDPDDNAFDNDYGLTKRELAVFMAMQGLAVKAWTWTWNEIAERAVLLADATIAALNKERGE